MKYRIHMNVLPGEPTDGTGRVCTHLLVIDASAAFSILAAVPADVNDAEQTGKLVVKPTKGRLACDPKRNPSPYIHGGVHFVSPHSIDPRAINCPKCKATEDYKREMKQQGEEV